MSAYSRIDFYRFRANNNLNQYPIVASHVGIAGLSFSEIGKYSKWRRTVHRRSRIELVKVKYTHRRPAGRILLNPWTLNLYDEDIFEILKSRGLIGIMFDRGRLGQSKVFPEYLGTMEFKELSNNFQKFHDADEWEEFSEPEIEMNEYESSILDFTDEFSFEELGEQNYGEYEKIGDDEGQGYFGFLQESADASQSEFQDDATVKALNNINATAFAEIKLDQNLEFNYQAAKAEPAELSEISYYDDGETISAFGQKSVIQKSNVSAIEYFIGNILHVLRVSHSQFGSFEPGINSLCIGTDFDGLIGPLNGFNNATKFPVFRDQLSIYLRRYLHNWPATQIDRLVTNLSYANAERFIKNNLD